MSRPTFEEFKKKALADPDVRKEYEALIPVYELKKKLISIRKAAGLTQQKMAERMGTKKSNISRLESPNVSGSPKLSTIEEYARAAGYQVKIDFVQDSAR
jgi:predicted transcriptional regulator